ncbi:serine/threonine-protein kinase [Gemmatimonas phototrophica]|uniref:serine/threonine-protein kinase n=1 Tax=Gemmatimonas phototrophica TaxID=1379270 RepID=UPI0006A71287|nr:serine/threonine-protein kinase [Gemmatimonas phototrophica]
MSDPIDDVNLSGLAGYGIPRDIGRYRIVSVLGEGGMGTVFEAEQDQPQRMVALKVIRPDYVLPKLILRFTREAEVLGRLQHPGIAQIYEAGTFANRDGQRPFFAMELVKGVSLTEYARANELDAQGRLSLFAKVCDAVHYAHQQGVIHRDLKPANILVDSSGQPKILDFGVALLSEGGLQKNRQTSLGEVVGTLQYMSPEQVNADQMPLDYRSDVYSLGVILYELLSGRLPYDLSSKLIFEAARVILVDEPAPLSSVNRQLRGDVEVIVSKALEKERQRRYSSANELASDVRRYLSDEPITARKASAMYQLRKFARRNRSLVTGLSIAAGVLVAGTVVSVWQAVRATAAERLADARREEALASRELAEQRRLQAEKALLAADSARAQADVARADAEQQQEIASASAVRATNEAARANAVNEFLQNMLNSSDPALAKGQELTVRSVLDRAAVRMDSGQFAGQPETRAGLESTIGRTYYALGLYDKAQPHLDSAYAIRLRVLGATNTQVATSAGDLGELARANGDFPTAERLLKQSLATARAKLPANDDQVTGTLSLLATVTYSLGRNADAERLHREALALSKSKYPRGGPIVAARLLSLGTFLLFAQQPEKALPYLEESLTLGRAANGELSPATVSTLIMLGDTRRQLRQFDIAERTYRTALQSARPLFGAQHPTVADVVSRLGGVLSDQSKFAEVDPLLKEAIAIRIAVLGEQHPDVQLGRVERGRFLQQLSRFAEAETLFTQAYEGRLARLGPTSPAVASSLQDLGYLAKLTENWPVVEKRYRESLPIWRAANIEVEVLRSEGEVGFALVKLNRNDEAYTLLTNVVARRKAMFGDNHWFTGDALEKLAGVELNRGRLVEAESLGTIGLRIRRTVYGDRSVPVAGHLQNMAVYREMQNDTLGSIAPLRESFRTFSALRAPNDRNVLLAQRWLAHNLCATGAIAEGDSLLRAGVALSPLDSTQPVPYRLRASLGDCLARQRKFAEAEPLLLEAQRVLNGFPTTSTILRTALVDMLVALYQGWGRAADAAAWSARRPPK